MAYSYVAISHTFLSAVRYVNSMLNVYYYSFKQARRRPADHFLGPVCEVKFGARHSDLLPNGSLFPNLVLINTSLGNVVKRIQRITRRFSLPQSTHIFPSSCGHVADSVAVEFQDGSYLNSRSKLILLYVVGSKSFRPDQLFKVTEIKQICYFST